MSNDTHRLVGDNHYHDGDRLRTGDTFTPGEAELDAFGFKFEALEDAEAEAADDAAADTADETDDAEAESDTDSDDETAIPAELPDDYNELRSLASDHGIKANQSKDDLIAELEDARE